MTRRKPWPREVLVRAMAIWLLNDVTVESIADRFGIGRTTLSSFIRRELELQPDQKLDRSQLNVKKR